ncbi:MAG: class I SAM-dependent methyltransferase [Rhodanobacter sp.]|nr:MAG: class I SAM-dependent methyltransferase [Rhodanobacter sp.]
MSRAARDAIAGLYDHRLQRGYIRWKLSADPVYPATAAIIANQPMPLLDIGCGIGLLAQYLHARGIAQRYLGLDHDERKISAGNRAVQRAGLDARMTMHHADVSDLPTFQGHVALLDVLHYLPADRQHALLQASVRHLAPEGCLIIRNVLREPNWRFHATRMEEFFLQASGWIPGGAQHYPSADELRTPLQHAGLEVDIRSLRGNTPYNSYLVVGRRRR